MKYKILYSKTNSSGLPLFRYAESKEEAVEIAERLKHYGYSVGVWEVSKTGSKQVL